MVDLQEKWLKNKIAIVLHWWSSNDMWTIPLVALSPDPVSALIPLVNWGGSDVTTAVISNAITQI